MILGFKRRFEPFVVDGSKTHTIRAIGGRNWRPGLICDCYVDSRQKTMRLLGRWPCVKVEPIEIYERAEGTFGVVVGPNELTPDEKDALAWRDGFRSYDQRETGAFVEMVRFWIEEHGDGRRISVARHNFPQGEPIAHTIGARPLAFKGQILHWDYSRPAADKGAL